MLHGSHFCFHNVEDRKLRVDITRPTASTGIFSAYYRQKKCTFSKSENFYRWSELWVVENGLQISRICLKLVDKLLHQVKFRKKNFLTEFKTTSFFAFYRNFATFSLFQNSNFFSQKKFSRKRRFHFFPYFMRILKPSCYNLVVTTICP